MNYKRLLKSGIATFLGGLFVATVLLIFNKFETGEMMNNRLTVAFPTTWGALDPSLQHTAIGDFILANQFESLVVQANGSSIRPLAARSFSISDDFQTYTFIIDTDRKFSDGTNLTAFDFKNSWEEGLKVTPISANHGVKDVLYMIEGYEDFEMSGKISGIVAESDQKLIVKFKKPYRLGLGFLIGTRFAAFRNTMNGKIGTGNYTITENGDGTLTLRKQPYSRETKGAKVIDVRVVPHTDTLNRIIGGNIDVSFYGRSLSNIEANEKADSIRSIEGAEQAHMLLALNAGSSSVFNKRENRAAFQYLMFKYFKDTMKDEVNKFGFRIDSQIFLPLQAGRLVDSKAIEIIEEGKKCVDSFVQDVKRTPLRFYTSSMSDDIPNVLLNLNLAFNSDFKITFDELNRKIDIPDAYDIMYVGVSVDNTDPDGVYHFLGETGAMNSPPFYNKSVGKLLEKGRSLLGQDEIENMYEKVSETFLFEAPVVHLGYSFGHTIYNESRVDFVGPEYARENLRFHMFEPTGD